MNDRFDQILVSQNVMYNNDNVQYQSGSYRAIGNDGLHYNSSLISGTNTIYPLNVVRALYYMSDHLPVELKVDVTFPTSNGLALVPGQNNVSCNNGNDGEATITPNLGQAPYVFQWDANANNQTGATATNLSTGTYCVIVTDNLGEVDNYCINITEPDPILYTSFITPDNSGNCTGDIQLLVDGGVGPYAYSWVDFPSNVSSSALNLCLGIYDVTIIDKVGCEIDLSIEVTGISGLASEVSGEQLIQLYPNPVNDKLTIHAENKIQAIRVLAITGREMNVDSNKLKDNVYELDTSKLSTGTYIVMMSFEGVWINSRIVVK